ncbi:hypothetical protein MTR67_014792 [Solanum verrucosum]|uniref:F-box domain-containing protein n=1 Tax=Solanum verrucosum TaxID=315347 RepID=A0AAF0QEL2_SOLVR|nr:hypothetical protein MTR67_014792 [Solanum verrucosum]
MEKLGHEDITSWLPAKSIMRFKCVCKAWNTLIEQPNFPKLHLARSSGTCLLFELSKDTQVYLFNVSTREIKALPFSVEGVMKNSMDPRLYLGFDKRRSSRIFHTNNIVNMMQTALRGKLVVYCGRRRVHHANLICNDLKKDFTKFVDYSDISEKVATLETDRIDMPTEILDAVLATASIISAQTSLLRPDQFRIAHVSSFVNNIIPLTSLF